MAINTKIKSYYYLYVSYYVFLCVFICYYLFLCLFIFLYLYLCVYMFSYVYIFIASFSYFSSCFYIWAPAVVSLLLVSLQFLTLDVSRQIDRSVYLSSIYLPYLYICLCVYIRLCLRYVHTHTQCSTRAVLYIHGWSWMELACIVQHRK